MLRSERRRVEQTVELQGDVKNSSRAADGHSVLLMPPKMASAGDAAATFDPSILQQEHEQCPLEEKLRQEGPRGGGPIPGTHPEAPPTAGSDPPEAPPTVDSDLLKLHPLLT